MNNCELIDSNSAELCAIEDSNNIRLEFDNYSQFCEYLSGIDDYELIVEYDNFIIVKINEQYFYLEQSDEGAAEGFSELKLVAELLYSINHDIKVDSEVLCTMFENDVCGECVEDKCIRYLWFKDIK